MRHASELNAQPPPEAAASAAAPLIAAGPLVLSPLVVAELDYLLSRDIGAAAQSALLGEIAQGSYRLDPFGAVDIESAKEIVERYAHLRIGLAEASIGVLAERHRARDVLTLDKRHFRALRINRRQRFRILPADKPAI